MFYPRPRNALTSFVTQEIDNEIMKNISCQNYLSETVLEVDYFVMVSFQRKVLTEYLIKNVAGTVEKPHQS